MKRVLFECDTCGKPGEAQALSDGKTGLPVDWMHYTLTRAAVGGNALKLKGHACSAKCVLEAMENDTAWYTPRPPAPSKPSHPDVTT